jgi:hypothetical protein
MNKQKRAKRQWTRAALAAVMVGIVLLSFAHVAVAVQDTGTYHYKMVSSLEYSGKGQFKHRTESLFTVDKEPLSGNKVQYSIWTDEAGSSGADYDSRGFGRISFVLDRANRELVTSSGNLSFFQMIHNYCTQSLEKVAADNIGKTWKQSFDLSFLDSFLPSELKLTVTAVDLKTDVLGDMIAVRALSEPFTFETTGIEDKTGKVKCKVNSVYVFDPSIEQIYMSISVFEATTKVNGFKERVRHELATYMTDGAAIPVDFTGLGKKFEKLVRKVGLINKDMKVTKPTDLPRWVRRDVLRVVGLADTCAALACEGAPNPVVTVCIPAGRMVAMQGLGHIAGSSQLGTVAMSLAKNIGPIGSMKIAVAPGIMGLSAMQAGAIAGGTVGGVAAGSGGGGGSDGVRSPSTP